MKSGNFRFRSFHYPFFIEVEMPTNVEFQTAAIRPVECYKEAWQLIKSQYGILLAVTIIGMIIGGVSLYVLLGAMVCGMFYCYFQAIDGRPVEIEGLFKGFNYFLPALLVTLVIVVPMLLVFGIIYVPFVLSMMMGARLGENELMAMLVGAIGVEIVFSLLMVCLHTLLMFAFPLIVDKNLSAWAAMKTSARAVWANLGGVVGLFVVGFFLSLAGYLLFCVGIYLVIPLIVGANVVAYRKIFPAAPNAF